jgi:hypothetical protein
MALLPHFRAVPTIWLVCVAPFSPPFGRRGEAAKDRASKAAGHHGPSIHTVDRRHLAFAQQLYAAPSAAEQHDSAVTQGNAKMLAEKFILFLETLLSRAEPDGCPRVVSTTPQVPVNLPRVASITSRVSQAAR